MITHKIHTKDGIQTVKTSPPRAIVLKCLDCCGFNKAEVRECTAETCPLHPYRTSAIRRAKNRILDGKPRVFAGGFKRKAVDPYVGMGEN